MKSFEQIKQELKKEFMDRNWQLDIHYSMYTLVCKFIEQEFYSKNNKNNCKFQPMAYYQLCPKCDRKKSKFRKQTNDYRCRLCCYIFKR